MLPFTRDEFLDSFAAYNQAVWPAQPIAYALALLALIALVREEEYFQRLALALLALMWAWTAIAFHWLFFSEINPAAAGFALLFIVQAGLLAALAGRRKLLFRLGWRSDAAGLAGGALIAAAAILYPVTDLAIGGWPWIPWLGIAPCPVTLLTLGLLLLARTRPPLWLWFVPVAWSLIGGTAAFLLGIVQDWILLAAGPAALWLALRTPRDKLSIAGGGRVP